MLVEDPPKPWMLLEVGTAIHPSEENFTASKPMNPHFEQWNETIGLSVRSGETP